jgi:polyisoprenoid-binding protein YceI
VVKEADDLVAIRRISIAFVSTALWVGLTPAAQRPIDAANSTMTVRVYKAGVFAAMGHDHEIAASITAGAVDIAARTVEVRVNASALKVQDPKASEKERAEIQSTMLGPDILDAEHHTEIVFRSKGAESVSEKSWRLHGDLTLHGQTHPVDVEVNETGGHYRGTALLRQTEFGIKPVKIAGGAVRVKDEIRIEFDIQLAH